MAEHDSSIVDLLKSAVRDAQELVHGEIALAKAELRDEMRRMGAGAALLAGAAAAAMMGVIFLLTTLAWLISEGLGWPVWIGFGAVTLLTLVAAGVLASMGRSRLATGPHMPKTMETMKENMEWMKARTR